MNDTDRDHGRDRTDVPELPSVIDCPAGFVPGTPEVNEMVNCADPVALALYEFSQNGRDHQKEGTEAGVELHCTRPDGSSYQAHFTGSETLEEVGADDTVDYLGVFNTWDKGLSPHYFYAFDGEPVVGGQGMHRRGGKVAATYLSTYHKAEIQIDGHVHNRRWLGRLGLQPDPFRGGPILKLQGEVTNEPPQVIRVGVKKPAREVVEALKRMPRMYLELNRKYGGALIPQAAHEPVEILQVPLEEGKVECLRNVVEEPLGKCRVMYVDGLRLTLPYVYDAECSIMPWGVKGLARSQGIYAVRRSKSSTAVEGSGSALAIAFAVRNLTDVGLLETLVRFANDHPEQGFREFPHFYGRGPTVAEPTKPVVQALWKKMNGGKTVLIAETDAELKWMASTGRGDEAAQPPLGLGEFLVGAGVPTVKKEHNVETNPVHQPDLNLPWIGKDGDFLRVMQLVLQEGGEYEISQSGRKRGIKITFPRSTEAEQDIVPKNESAFGKVLCILQAWCQKRGLDCRMISPGAEADHDIVIQVEQESGPTYKIRVVIVKKKHSTEGPRHGTLKPGNTYIGIKGEFLDGLKAAELEVLRGLLDVQRRVRGFLAGASTEERGPRSSVGRRGHVRSSGERHALSDSRTSSVGVDAGSASVSWEWPEALDGAESIMPPGFYASFVGTRFEMDDASGEVQWAAPNIFVPIRITNEEAPRRFSSRIVLKNLKGKAGLMVHEQDEIVALKVEAAPGTQYQILKNVATGMYEIDITAGSIQTLRYWTAEDPRANQQGPLPEDTMPLAARELLDAKRLRQIGAVMAVPSAERLMKILQTWPREFVYSDDPDANEQFNGGSIAVVVAKMLNMAKGTCNVAATDTVLFARETHNAARYRSGWVVKRDGTMGTHASALLNDGQNWLVYDPTVDARREEAPETPAAAPREGVDRQVGAAAGGEKAIEGAAPSPRSPLKVNTQLPEFPPETPAQVQRSVTADFRDWLRAADRDQGASPGGRFGRVPSNMAAGLEGLLESLEASGLGMPTQPRRTGCGEPAAPSVDFGALMHLLMESMATPDPREVERLEFEAEGEEYAALLRACNGDLAMAKACLSAMQSEGGFAAGIPIIPPAIVMPELPTEMVVHQDPEEPSVLDEPYEEENPFSRLPRAVSAFIEAFGSEVAENDPWEDHSQEKLWSRLLRAWRRFLEEVRVK